MNEQQDLSLEYLKAVESASQVLSKYVFEPWKWIDILYFNFTTEGRQVMKDINTMKNFTGQVSG